MTKAPTGRDFVTLLRIDGDRANKLVRREPDGQITKLGAVESGVYVAQSFHVPDAEAFADLLRQVGEDPRLVISLGIFKDAGEGTFLVWPRKRIARNMLQMAGQSSAVAGWRLNMRVLYELRSRARLLAARA